MMKSTLAYLIYYCKLEGLWMLACMYNNWSWFLMLNDTNLCAWLRFLAKDCLHSFYRTSNCDGDGHWDILEIKHILTIIWINLIKGVLKVHAWVNFIASQRRRKTVKSFSSSFKKYHFSQKNFSWQKKREAKKAAVTWL